MLRAASAVAFGALCSATYAQVAFNDFASDANSATYGYATNVGWTISGASSAVSEFVCANQFVSGASGSVSDVILPLNYASGDPNATIDVQLVADNANMPGTVLESWTVGTSGTFGSWSAPETLTGDGSASLAAGTSYWLVLSPTNVGNSDLWAVLNYNEAGATGLDLYNQGSGWASNPGATLGAFEVDVAPTPEPATMTLLGLGIAGLIARRRRA